MAASAAAAFLELVDAREGHFRLESGHHGALWLDLDALFAAPQAISPFVAQLVEQLRPHAPEMIAGPLLGGAFLAQLAAHSLGVEFCYTTPSRPAGEAGLYPVRHQLPTAFSARIRGRRVALVDDVMSAGSALRATYLELKAHGAIPVAAGAVLLLGDVGAGYFARQSLPVESVAREAYTLWQPAECPLCAAGRPLER